MQYSIKQIWYVRELNSDCGVKYYDTLAKARIALRQRNRRRGLTERVQRVEDPEQGIEWEQCVLPDGTVIDSDLIIAHSTIEELVL